MKDIDLGVRLVWQRPERVALALVGGALIVAGAYLVGVRVESVGLS